MISTHKIFANECHLVEYIVLDDVCGDQYMPQEFSHLPIPFYIQELTMKGRLINLNGVVFYDTKSNDPNGFGEGTPLVFTVGDKSALPGLESGIADMRRGGIRRIIVPADQGYGGYPALQPQPLTDMERRALDSVIKNPRRDQTVMFDVKVERVR